MNHPMTTRVQSRPPHEGMQDVSFKHLYHTGEIIIFNLIKLSVEWL